MRVIGVVSGKGGVGKTTVAINAGAHLVSKSNKNVMIVDCNITTPHVPLHLGMSYIPATLNHVMKGESDLKEAIYNHSSGLKIIPASMAMSDLDGIDLFKLQSVVDNISDKYFGKIDFLILDCASGFGREAMSAMKACNEMLFVTTPQTPSIMDTVRCRHVAENMNIKILGTALNMVTGDKGELKAKDVEAITGTKVLASIPYDRKVLKNMASGMPLTSGRTRSKAKKRMGELADSIL